MTSSQSTGVDIVSDRDTMDTIFNKWDFMTLGLYFFFVVVTGIYSSCRSDRNTITGYFLAGRFMWWLPVGASLFASNIGSEHFIGLAGSGAAAGIYVGAFELNALILLQLLGWVFLPVFIASGVTTVPEYMYKRFGGKRIQTSLAVFSLSLYVFTKISVNMFSGAIFIQQAFRWNNLYVSVCALLAMTAVLTIGGGLSAVIYTDTLQFFIMNFGSIFVAIKALIAVGGFEELRAKYMTAIPDVLIPNSTCGIPTTNSWVMLQSANPAESDMPWLGFLLGQTPASIWYWCADQMMVQRVMAAKSLSHAKGATIFAGYTKLLPLFAIIIPGMVARVLFPNEIGCVDPKECQKFCGLDTCTNFAYPKLAFSLMPSGLRGVMLSVMLSALISDLTSIFNSASTLFTMDIWTLGRPRASGREKIIVGRTFIVILVLISIAWIPVIEQTQSGELYIYIQAIAAYLSPPIAAVYCLAILSQRVNESGVFWGMMSGFLVGVIRMVVDFMFRAPPCYEDDVRPFFIKNFHYMYFATFLFWFTIGMTVLISLVTDPPPSWRLIRTTFKTRFDKGERDDERNPGEKTQYEMSPVSKEGKDFTTRGDRRRTEHHVLEFCCGPVDSPERKVEDSSPNGPRVINLHQEEWEVKILNVMLVIVIAVAFIFYIYFSINPFSRQEIAQMQQAKLLHIHNETAKRDFTAL